MTVKDRIGRKRYIGFKITCKDDAPFQRGAVIRAFNRAGSQGMLHPWLTEFDGLRGIVRCPHTEKDGVIAAVGSITRIDNRFVQIRTVTTSGCIGKVKRTLFGNLTGKRSKEERKTRTSGSAGERKRESHVATSFLQNEGKVLILKRSEKVSTFGGRWAAVSGTVEDGETPIRTAYREIEEETGLSEKQVTLLKSGKELRVEADEGIFIVHPFLFESKTDAITIDWEHSEYAWIRKVDLGKYETVPKLAEALEWVFT